VPESWITEQMRQLEGKVVETRTSLPVTASDIRRWAVAVYYPDPPPPELWDEDAAARSPSGGLVAPEEFNPFAWITTAGPPAASERRTSGVRLEERLGVTAPPTTATLNGGLECRYGPARMRPGDVIHETKTLAGYSERTGRLGLMLFTVTETTWTNQAGELVRTQRDTVIRY
jgi:hypothetical protein